MQILSEPLPKINPVNPAEQQATSKEASPQQVIYVPTPTMIGSMPDLARLASKIIKIMASCSHIDKAGFNDFHHYNYVKAEDVMAALNKACVENRVACLPRFTKLSETQKTQRSGQIATIVTVQAEIFLIDADTGASISVVALGTGEDAGDKAVAKAQTMAIKYALMSTCLISTGDDPEADSSTDEQNLPAKKAVCKCGGSAYKTGSAQFEGEPVEVYTCRDCGKVFRQKA